MMEDRTIVENNKKRLSIIEKIEIGESKLREFMHGLLALILLVCFILSIILGFYYSFKMVLGW